MLDGIVLLLGLPQIVAEVVVQLCILWQCRQVRSRTNNTCLLSQPAKQFLARVQKYLMPCSKGFLERTIRNKQQFLVMLICEIVLAGVSKYLMPSSKGFLGREINVAKGSQYRILNRVQRGRSIRRHKTQSSTRRKCTKLILEQDLKFKSGGRNFTLKIG